MRRLLHNSDRPVRGFALQVLDALNASFPHLLTLHNAAVDAWTAKAIEPCVLSNAHITTADLLLELGSQGWHPGWRRRRRNGSMQAAGRARRPSARAGAGDDAPVVHRRHLRRLGPRPQEGDAEVGRQVGGHRGHVCVFCRTASRASRCATPSSATCSRRAPTSPCRRGRRLPAPRAVEFWVTTILRTRSSTSCENRGRGTARGRRPPTRRTRRRRCRRRCSLPTEGAPAGLCGAATRSTRPRHATIAAAPKKRSVCPRAATARSTAACTSMPSVRWRRSCRAARRPSPTRRAAPSCGAACSASRAAARTARACAAAATGSSAPTRSRRARRASRASSVLPGAVMRLVVDTTAPVDANLTTAASSRSPTWRRTRVWASAPSRAGQRRVRAAGVDALQVAAPAPPGGGRGARNVSVASDVEVAVSGAAACVVRLENTPRRGGSGPTAK